MLYTTSYRSKQASSIAGSYSDGRPRARGNPFAPTLLLAAISFAGQAGWATARIRVGEATIDTRSSVIESSLRELRYEETIRYGRARRRCSMRDSASVQSGILAPLRLVDLSRWLLARSG